MGVFLFTHGENVNRSALKENPEIQVSGGSALFPLRAQARLHARF